MAESEITQLKEALCTQCVLMRKLSMELEQEREASAIATGEALSMILRLEREKAMEKMEACQYKRLVEEKMNHTEQTLEVLEEIMQLKVLEINVLKNQLQEYKQKLSGMGVNVLDIANETMTSDASMCGSNVRNSNTSVSHSHIKRNVSLPILQFNKLHLEMDHIRESSPIKESIISCLGDFVSHLTDKCNEHDKKELAGEVHIGGNKEKHEFESSSVTNTDLVCSVEEPSSCSSYSEVRHNASSPTMKMRFLDAKSYGEETDLVAEDVENVLDYGQLNALQLEIELKEITTHPTNALDIFEVPESNNSSSLASKKVLEQSNFETENIIKEDESAPSDAANKQFEKHWINMESIPKERRSRALSKLATTRNVGSSNNIQRNVKPDTETSTSKSNLEQIKIRLKWLENEKTVELDDSKRSKEQLILLREIYEQLSMIESHMKPSGSQGRPQQDDSSLISVTEAAVSFSI